MAKISNNDIARSIYLSFKGKTGGELRLHFKNVVKFLARKRLLPKSKDILLRLQKIINLEEKRIIARITSVKNLKNETKKNLVRLLKKRYSAKDVALEERYDKNLLGGMRVEVDDEVIDLTIKNRLGQLEEYLISKV